VKTSQIIFEFLSKYVEDIFIFGGLGVVIFATFKLNWFAGMYILGSILVLFGLILSKKLGK
jgi:hypothetical protein